MAEIWITLTLTDKANGDAVLGTKEFLVNFSSPDPLVWFANPLAWATQALQLQSDMAVLETQEAILAQRRADLEAAANAPPVDPPA